ncbi:MAG: 3-oxoacyl-ACP synthase [Myxococcaceae bacterium]|nr:MAG: 3-oxoacyl-ACP synthase [Myxococcaceae bacterium]
MDETVVISAGLCTPLGLTAPSTLREMAAGTVRFFETDVLDSAGEPVRASVLTLLDGNQSRTERMVSLAVTALQEALSPVSGAGLESVPLLLALPEPDTGASFELEVLREELITAAAPVRLEVSANSLRREGRAGFFAALVEASRLLKARKALHVLVGGVDSMCDRVSLAHQARMGRSLGPGTRDGTLPGEGAGFFLLTTVEASRQRRWVAQGRVVGCSLAREPHSFLQREPNRAEGLTDAFRQLRCDPVAGVRRVDHILSCQTGETFWAQEFNSAYLRNASLMPEPLTLTQVAESLGDAGAAAGAIQFGCALHLLDGFETASGEVGRVLVYGCSDTGHVGACVVEGAS